MTELITGIDLVEQMIRVAAGEKLSITQDDVKIDGWAVESRVYAEDPYRNFLPSTGRLVKYRPPAEGKEDGVTVRNDTGVTEGSEISMFYDPMIAKLVTHAPTRIEAIDAQAKALDAFVIDGIQPNIPFLTALMQHPRWRDGALSTGFIKEEYPDGFAGRAVDAEARGVLAIAALAMELVRKERLDHLGGRLKPHSGKWQRDWVVRLDREQVQVTVPEGYPAVPLEVDMVVDGVKQTVSSDWRPGEGVWIGQIGDKEVAVQTRPALGGSILAWRGVSIYARAMLPSVAELDALMPVKLPPDLSKFLLCPMPGLVVSIAVTEGQEVKAGETLAVVEAMKMENVLRAERDGVVGSIKAKPGDSLAVDAVILEFA